MRGYTLAVRIADAGFAHLLANADFSQTPVKDVEPYKILDIDGLNVAILGLVTTDDEGHPVGILENFGKTRFSDPLETAAKYRHLRDAADVYIALTHVGFDSDSLLALANPEIDLIIGGHSHTVLPQGRKINNTLVTQTGKNLTYAGITVITHSGKKIKSIENRLVKLDTIPGDPGIAAIVAKYNNEPALLRTIGTIGSDLDKAGLLNMFSDIMRVEAKADIAFYNAGGMRLDSLKKGDVSYKDMYSAEPFGNTPVVVEMKASDIARFIRNKFNSTGKESHSIDLWPSGMTYTVVTDGEGNATDIIFRPVLDDKKVYKVVMSNYVNGAYDFDQRGQGTASKTAISDTAIGYFLRNGTFNGNNDMRVKIE